MTKTDVGMTGTKRRILVVGSTGRIGSKVLAHLEQSSDLQPVYCTRRKDQLDAWHHNGKEAVLLDLDDPANFKQALAGIHYVFLVTGYTAAMVQQSKNIVDAAVDAGVSFIVHLGVFGNGRLTYAYGAWHEIVERYIEGSGMAWTHLHPHFFMDNLLAASPVIEGQLYWFMGERRVGWIAPEDVAAVASHVLEEGPELHGGKQYWLATEMLNGTEAAVEISKGLGLSVVGKTLTPDDLAKGVTSGAVKMPGFIDPLYGASILEWVQQTYEGRLAFSDVVTTSVKDLTGEDALTLEKWVSLNREAVLSASL